jgi:hypothetical protein
MLARDERAHLRLGVHPVADLDLREPLADRRHERVGHVPDRHDLRHGHAALAGRAVARAHRRVGGHVDVRVRQHDHVVLRASERLHALAVLRPALVDVARNRRRADEADRDDVRVLEHRVNGHLVAVDDVEDAVRHTRLLEQLGHVHRRGRILLGRLEHERVPARERGRPHPHGHHRGKVERRDAGDDAERLPDRVHVDSGRGLLGEPALQKLRDPAAELDHLEPARDLALRVREDLPVLGGEDLGDLVAALVHEVAHAEEELGAPRERERTPDREGLLRRLDGAVDLLGTCEVDGAGLLPSRRVVDRAGAT